MGAADFAAAVSAARAAFGADAGRLWGADLTDSAWMGITGDQLVLTADPALPAYRADRDDLWVGPRPATVPLTSTPVDWAGRRWAGVVLPVPTDADTALRCLLHEACHVAQPAHLPRHPAGTESAPGADVLNTAEGRTWLRLELVALSHALGTSRRPDPVAAGAALLFRRRRYALASEPERVRETALDITEGLPEYTAWRLSRADRAALVEHVRTSGATASVEHSAVRDFAYSTGPAYGYLLDDLVPDWRLRVREVLDLQQLLAPAVPELPLDEAETVAVEYGIGAIRAEESAREELTRERIRMLTRQFTAGPVVRVRPGQLTISFDPRTVTPLETGTFYLDLRWQPGDGSELEAPAGGLVSADWSEVVVPLDDATFAAGPPSLPATLVGPGWTLRLTDAWRLVPRDRSWVITPRGPARPGDSPD